MVATVASYTRLLVLISFILQSVITNQYYKIKTTLQIAPNNYFQLVSIEFNCENTLCSF